MKNTADEQFLERSLKLAAEGAGFVSPNPMVGCVIVKNGRVVVKNIIVILAGRTQRL